MSSNDLNSTILIAVLVSGVLQMSEPRTCVPADPNVPAPRSIVEKTRDWIMEQYEKSGM